MSGMRFRRVLGVAVLLVSIQALAASKASSQAHPAASSNYAVNSLRIPLLFEANAGQVDPGISYLARAHGYTLLLKSSGPAVELADGTQLVLQFRGTPDISRIETQDPSQVRINYYRGHNSSDWHTGVATYERVAYRHLYPGIDLQFYGNQRQLEHDFVVSPGSNPSLIAFSFAGATSQRIDTNGDLVLNLKDGEVRLKAPLAYQEDDARRKTVSSRYKLAADGSIGFALGKYDRRRALVIDPILSLSTYLGGNGNDSLRGVAVFPGTVAPGWIFAAGVTNSTNLSATVGQTALKGTVNGYIALFNISTNALVWITYFGGSGSDYLNALATDASGNAYIGGDTTSADLPLAGSSISTSLSGPQDGYVAEINSAGALIYSTYLGGTAADRVLGIAVDSTGLIDVTGSTFSSDFPTTNPVQAFQGTGATCDLFVTQINKTTGTLPFSTTYGGTGNETGRAIAVDSSNLIHVTGETTSTDFPSVPGLPPVFGQTSGFVVMFDPVKAGVDYSNIFGGSGSTFPTGIVADGNGTFLTGSTNSTDFPITSGSVQTTLAGGYDAFVAQLFPSGNGYVYATYLGGSGNDNNDGSLFLGGVAVNGQAYLTGYTESPDFPVINPTYGLLPAKRSAFVTKVNTGGASLAFSTFLGGSTQSQGWGIAVDTSNSNIYVVGDTTDTDFPLATAAQSINGGGSDGFVAAYQQPTTNSDIGVTVNPSTTTPVTGTSYTYSISVINNGNNSAGASNVMLFDTLPANVVVNSIFPFQGTCTQPTPQTIACNIGHINIANIVIISVTVTPIAAGTLTNLAVVRSDDNDPTLTNNNVTTTVTAAFGSCYNPNLATKGWKGGTSGSPTDFNNANNWDPAGIPAATDDIIICPQASFQPVATADLTVNNVLMTTGATLDLGTHALTANGNVQATTISNGTVITAGSPSIIQGTVPNLSVGGTATLSGNLTVNGNVIDGGSLTLGGFTATVSGIFVTQGIGVLVMQTALDHLTVSNNATFGGGNEAGLLSAGLLDLGGSFTATSGPTFSASGIHRVRFIGTGTQNVAFAAAGTGSENFQEIEVLNGGTVAFTTNALINGNATITSGTMNGAGTVTLGGNILAVAGSSWQVANTVVTSASPAIPSGLTTNLTFSAASTLPLGFTVNGSLTTTGSLTLNGQAVTVNGAFQTSGTGVLSMQNSVDHLVVNGNVTFQGGDETGRLSAGNLDLTGNFTLPAGPVFSTFQGSGSHRVRFAGTGVQTISFAQNGAQFFQDMEVLGGGTVTFANPAIVNGSVYLTSGGAIGSTTVTLGGNLIDGVGNKWQVASTVITGAAPVLPNMLTAASFIGNTVLSNSFTVTGNVVVSGSLNLAANTLNVSTTFATTSNGVLIMQSPSSHLVAASALFAGSSESGLLTNGILDVGASLSASAAAAIDTFNATSPHLTRFTGSVSSVSMTNPGTGQQFGDVTVLSSLALGTPISVQGTFTANTGNTISGTGLLSVGGVAVNNATFSGTPISIGNGTISQFDNVTMSSMDPTVTQLAITHDGSSTPFTFNALSFDTTPTTGKYVQLTNTNSSLGQLVLELPASTPADGTAFTTVDANSKVNWNFAPGPDIQVTVAPTPLSATVGQTINYSVTVSNVGTAGATGVNLALTYTPFNGGINVTGASCSGGTTINCSIGNLAQGANIVINAAVTSVDAIAITVTGTATLNETDSNPANNTANAPANFTPIGNPPIGSITGTLLYSRSDTSVGTVWQAAGDGSSDTQLFVGAWPRLSPDQNLIAYHNGTNDGSNYPSRGNLYIHNLTAGTDTLAFSNNDYQNAYSFTADSAQVYFDYACGEYKVNTDGTGLTNVFQVDCYDDDPRFNETGTQLAFENAHSGIGLFNPDGSGRTFIPNTAPNDFMPAWSPDGTRIAFVRFVTGGAANLFVINPDGSNLTRLSFLTVANDGPLYGSIAWTPDGSSVVFAGAVNGIAGLYAAASDGSGGLVQLGISAGNPPNWVGSIFANSADVVVTSSVPPAATAGNTLPLSVIITNNGPGVASGIVLTTTLPAGTSFISGFANQSQPWPLSCSAAGQTVTCTVNAPLPPAQSMQVLIDVAVQASGTLNFLSSVSSTTADPNPDNNNSQASTQVSPAACVPPPSGMVSWYRGEFNFTDYTGAHNATTVGSPTFVPGKVGEAFSFDGASSYLDLTGVSGLWNPGSQWTVEAWVNPNTTDLSRHEVVGAINNAIDWGIVYQNGQFGTVISPPSGTTATVFSNYPADLNTFSHVVATNDGTTASIYVNGQFYGSLPVKANYIGDNEPRIADRSGTAPSEFFSGAVDEATIYNRALSATEIATLFNAGSAGKCAAPTGSSADIALTAASGPVVVNGHPAYTVTVSNNGPSPATNVIVTDTLDNFGFVAASTTQGNCLFDGNAVACGIGSLAVGSNATVTVSVNPPSQGWAAHEFSASADEPDPVPTNNLARIGPPDSSFNTSVGSDISVQATDSTGDSAQVTFANVSRKGTTSLQAIAAIAPPAGFRHANPPAVFDVATTATTTGAVQLSFAFNPAAFHHPSKARLFHLEAGAWVDRTTSVDIAAKRVAGATASLSPFAIFEPLDNPPVADPGTDRSTSGNLPTGSSVTLNGAASTDADGDTLTYRWTGPFPEGSGTVTGVSPVVTLPFGTSKISLVVNDGEVDSPAVAANITVTDFKLTASANNPVVKTGEAATYTINLAPQLGSFDAAINLSCSGLPAGLSCSFASPSVTPGVNPAVVSLTISKGGVASKVSHHPIFALWLGLPIGAVFLGAGLRRRRALLLLIALAVLVGMIACGGGGGGSGFTTSSSSSTTTTVTISGSSGTLTHAASVQLTVQ